MSQSGRAETKLLGAAAKADAMTATAAGDASTPEAWLQHIRALRAAGRSAEAAQSLVRFRSRYPALQLPDDLTDLK